MNPRCLLNPIVRPVETKLYRDAIFNVSFVDTYFTEYGFALPSVLILLAQHLSVEISPFRPSYQWFSHLKSSK